MSVPFLPFNRPDVSDEEIDEVVAALRSGWTTSGPRAQKLEQQVREYTGAKNALAVNSCTAALHLALAALDIGPGDEVITTPLTFCATVNTILHVGGTPVLVDIGADFNIDPEHIAAAITPRTKAIVPVHMAGLPCDLDAIHALARQHGLAVIEDAAHAIGSSYKGVPIGAGPSDAVAFSFYATKNVSTGEGGMVTSPSLDLHNRMRTLCLHGISRDAWRRYTAEGSWFYDVVASGFKYNLSDIAAASGIHQLRAVDARNARRAEIAQRFDAAFADLDTLELPPRRDDSLHSWHLYILRLNLDRLTIDRGEFYDEMRKREIGCGVHFIPVFLHSYYRETLQLRDNCDKTRAEYPRILSLPLYPSLTDDEIERVIGAVREIATTCRRTHAVGVQAQ